MSADHLKPEADKNKPAKNPEPKPAVQPTAAKAPEAKPATPPGGKLPPLFRKIDWLTFGVTSLLVFIGFFLTLAPELTLEDSGELAVGSFYAGVPHPPGYPVWTIFTWLFTVLVPVGNIAYRVGIASAFSGAVSAGLIGLLTSRGSSMLIESIEDFKGISRKLENVICVVSGFVAGTLLAYNGYMWSQSVIVEVYPFSVLSLMGVFCFLLRWVYAPHQKRYLYLAWFLFGISFTNHQTLIVAAMGIEVAILAAKPKLGRDLLLLNSMCYILGLFAIYSGFLGTFQPNEMVIIIFHMVGVLSLLGCAALSLWGAGDSTPEVFARQIILPVASLILCALLGVSFFNGHNAFLAMILGVGILAMWIVFTLKFDSEIMPAVFMLFLWVVGAAFFLYMPLTSMTNPPMNWGYPRTLEGFIHALTRGQYEKANPTNFLNDPLRLVMQVFMYFEGAYEEFNFVNLALVLVPFFFIFKVQKRERAWMIGLTAIWFFLAMLLMVLLNPAPDKASRELNRVFFTASYTVLSIFIGYGLTLTAAYMATHYEKFRKWGLIGGGIAAALALFTLTDSTLTMYGEDPDGGFWSQFFYAIRHCFTLAAFAVHRVFAKNQYGLPIIAGFLLLGFILLFLLNLTSRARGRVGVALALFALLPLHSILSHWSDNEQRNHWFGYWFGHDMFTPPFVGPDGKFSYDAKLREQVMKGTNGNLVYPEMTHDAVLFGGTDPGRFCPTYMIFDESFTPHDKQPKQDQKFDRRDVYIITQNALADGTYLEYIRAHYNRSAQIDPPFFQECLRSTKEKELNYTTNFVARLAYQLLDRPFLAHGAKVEARRRAEGVYPPKEIITPSQEDSQQCFQEYLGDAQRRLEHDSRFPNEPRQIKPGEDVHVIDNRVQVSGQVAVMSINGLLTKVIFDKNPDHEFFVEESFPLDWMYPYLTPFGVIMKINRQPVPEYTDDIIQRDHAFWSKYSERLIGNWITYDTSVKEIADFVEKVYLQRDFNGFKGDRKFIRDDQAQKAFSKLRSSIGGIYNWRIANAKTDAERQRAYKEADFTFKQALAFCPYSPEAVYRYVQLLVQYNRLDDAILVASTCHKLDPNNGQIDQLMLQLQDIKTKSHGVAVPPGVNMAQLSAVIEQLEKDAKANPDNFQSAFNLAMAYLQNQQTDKASQVLDGVLSNPKVNVQAVMFVAKAFADLRDYGHLEKSLEKLTQLSPDSPEAWYDLAAMKVVFNKTNEAVACLRHALDNNSKRLAKDPKATNLLLTARSDARFTPLRQSKEAQQLLGL